MTDKQSAEIKQGLLAVKFENINIVGWDGISLMRNLFNIGFSRIKDNTYYYFNNGRVFTSTHNILGPGKEINLIDLINTKETMESIKSIQNKLKNRTVSIYLDECTTEKVDKMKELWPIVSITYWEAGKFYTGEAGNVTKRNTSSTNDVININDLIEETPTLKFLSKVLVSDDGQSWEDGFTYLAEIPEEDCEAKHVVHNERLVTSEWKFVKLKTY